MQLGLEQVVDAARIGFAGELGRDPVRNVEDCVPDVASGLELFALDGCGVQELAAAALIVQLESSSALVSDAQLRGDERPLGGW